MFDFIGRKKIKAFKLGKLFAKSLINLGENSFHDFIFLVENIDYFENKLHDLVLKSNISLNKINIEHEMIKNETSNK